MENLIAGYGGKPTDSKADLLSLVSLTYEIKKKKGNALNGQNETRDNKNDRMTPQEIEILNTKEDALIKNAEILAYEKVLKVAEKITEKDAIDVLKQNLQVKESTYTNIAVSESKMLSDMRISSDHVNESFNLGSAVADMLTSYWNLKENPSKVYLFNRRVHRTRFRDIHFKPYTEAEFVEIVVSVLDIEEGVDRDIALLIADGVYNRLKSSNPRECVRIARLAKNDPTQVNRIIDTFAKYANFSLFHLILLFSIPEQM